MNSPPPTQPPAALAERLPLAVLRALPHHLLSAVMRHATRVRLRAWKNWQIRWFIRRYGVDMGIACASDPRSFADFNAFFTRALRDGARPVCRGGADVACPADGELSEFGAIDHDTLLQAKGRSYSLTQLLGGDAARAAALSGGHFATIYLAPRDYHRVHMPLAGTLREMIHVPGRLFSVNQVSARHVPDLFTRNERVVSMFDTAHGPLAVVLIGAIFVGSIEQVWAGEVAPARGAGLRVTRYPSAGRGAVTLAKGAEMGRFNMGSTVIVVLPPGPLSWPTRLTRGAATRFGEPLATLG
jgi:phosphatidylserine decarboxylase